MSQIESIRDQWSNGKSVSEIARALGIDRNTVYKYVKMEDFSEDAAYYQPKGCILDGFREDILSMLKEEQKWHRKQRYTAKRILKILKEMHPELECSYTTAARYVTRMKKELRRESCYGPGTMPLAWHEGEAQADFGEADFMIAGQPERLKYLNLAFPFSNKVFTVISGGETSECVCFCLWQVFRYIGKVPNRIVFDNATGIGHRAFGVMKETDLFTRFRLHYGFRCTFANPRAGYEKGCVENSIGAVRRNLFVPPMEAYRPFSLFNDRVMLPLSDSYRDGEEHYRKDESIAALFRRELDSMDDMNPREFRIERFESMVLSGTGTLKLDSRHEYVLGPAYSGMRMTVGRTAESINFYTLDGKLQKSFERLYGNEHTVAYDLEAMLKGLVGKPNSWMNSPVRDAIDDNAFRRYVDNSGSRERWHILNMLSNNADEFGFGISCVAMEELFSKGRVPSKEDLASLSRRLQAFPSCDPVNPTGVDLKVYDALLRCKEAR